MFRSSNMIVFLFLISGAIMAQERFTHTCGLSFVLPANWSYTAEGDHFEATSPDESVVLLFFTGKSAVVEEALRLAVQELDGIIEDAQITTAAIDEVVNGMTQSYVEGDGYVEGEEIDWDLTFTQGSRSSMVIIGLGDIEGMQSTITGIYASISE